MGRLDGKVIVMTGSASGIGYASAKLFAQEGAKVVAGDFDVEGGQKNAEEIKAAGGEITFIKTDMRSFDDMDHLVKTAIDKYGQIDVLYNCAGVLVHKDFEDWTLDDFNYVTDIDYRGPFFLMQKVLPLMKKAGKGTVINVASISCNKPETRAYAYSGAKAAVNMVSKGLAMEYGPYGIRINVIAPGPIDTPLPIKGGVRIDPNIPPEEGLKKLVPLGRPGQPSEVGWLAVFLASDESSYINGATCVIDGGIM